jgi:hypothetical protein
MELGGEGERGSWRGYEYWREDFRFQMSGVRTGS